MASSLNYDQIHCCLTYIPYMVHELDFSMLLMNEYQHAHEGTQLSLVKKPTDNLDVIIDAYISEHYDELYQRTFVCEKCGISYPEYEKHNACIDSIRYDLLTGEHKRCGGQLKLIVHEKSHEHLRETARNRLADTDEYLRWIVSGWIVSGLEAGCPHGSGEDITLPLRQVFHRIRLLVNADYRKVQPVINALERENFFGDRIDLMLQGTTLDDQYADYSQTRNNLIAAYNLVVGLSKNNEECLDDSYGVPRSYPFRPAIHLPAGTVILPDYCWRLNGDRWVLSFRSENGSYAHQKGFLYIHRLLQESNSNKPITALELHRVYSKKTGDQPPPGFHGSDQTVSDKDALAMYKKRIDECDQEIEDATKIGDTTAAEVAQNEKDDIRNCIKNSTRPGKTHRPLGKTPPNQTASNSVKKCIDRIIEKLGENKSKKSTPMPKLASHLKKHIKSENYEFSYLPTAQIDWQL